MNTTRCIDGFQMNLLRKTRIGSYNINFYNLGFRKGVDLSCKTKNINIASDYHGKNIEKIDYQKLPYNVKKVIKNYILK